MLNLKEMNFYFGLKKLGLVKIGTKLVPWTLTLRASFVTPRPDEVHSICNCRTPVCWDEVGERRLVGPELVQITSEKVKVVRDNLKIARDR